MLLPISTSGTRPPFFVVHGLFGIMPLGYRLAEALGPDQPVYALHAEGLQGVSHRSVAEMAEAYLRQLHAVRPRGPYLLGGLCAGSQIALEMAARLSDAGEEIVSVLIIEPNAILRVNSPLKALPAAIADAACAQMRQTSRDWFVEHAPNFYGLPFDFNEPGQLDRLAVTAVDLILAFEQHMPQPYGGSVDIIACRQRANLIGNPNLPWRRRVLVGPWSLTALECPHEEVFTKSLERLLDALRILLQRMQDRPGVGRQLHFPGDAIQVG